VHDVSREFMDEKDPEFEEFLGWYWNYYQAQFFRKTEKRD